MTLTKDDLQAIRDIISEENKEIRESQGALEKGQAQLQKDVDELKQSVDHVRGSVVIIENIHGKKIESIYDGFQDVQRNLIRLSPLEEKIENHDDRIWALEMVAKAN